MELLDYEKKHIELLEKLAPECMVLLKKDGSFPIDKPCRISLYGSGVRHTIKGGTGSGDVNSRFFYTVEDGFKERGFEILTTEWLDSYEEVLVNARKDFIKEVKTYARTQHKFAAIVAMGMSMREPDYSIPLSGESEVCVYVLSRICGEGNDRRADKGDFYLTDTEVRDILECNKKYKKFILVLNVGGVVDLTPVKEVKNILLMSELGVVSGLALADVILGLSYPSGKLTDTWIDVKEYEKMGEFGNLTDTRYNEGIYVGYRYFDTLGIKPLYPFGYGLSYTEFEINVSKVEVDDDLLRVSVNVKNIGNYKGKEVIELYVTKPNDKLDHPSHELIAFKKTKELNPNEDETLTIELTLDELKSYRVSDGSYIVEKGEFILSIGSSLESLTSFVRLNINEEKVIETLNHVGGNPDFKDFIPNNRIIPESSDIPTINIDSKCIKNHHPKGDSSLSQESIEYVKKLSDEDLCELVIGSHKQRSFILSFVGEQGSTVPGSTGETYSKIDGLRTIIMADGPAGIRVPQKYIIKKNGLKVPIISKLPSDIKDFLPKIIRWVFFPNDNKDYKEDIHYQYTTAIPVGIALAQSFNEDVLYECGKIISLEMRIIGVQMWLAPALNIHRNPLCGRNFEYYSEDPYLTGKICAAIVKGAESDGLMTTIKHFCCNNQEFYRNNNSSILSERALREIYMKGFEIAIKDANPGALMSSYNLINGIHSTERRDLITEVLRNEWGYNGLIMTDWIMPITEPKDPKYRQVHPAEAIDAGTDLFMPGSDKNYKDVLNALKGRRKDITLKRETIENSAARIIDTIKRIKY